MTSPPTTETSVVFEYPERLSTFFHMVNRLLPDTPPLWIGPSMLAREALQLMAEHGYSQLPVREGDTVLGLFTYRAFAREVAEMAGSKQDPTLLPVEEFLEHEKMVFARLQDEFRGLIDDLDHHDAVLVSGPEDLIAILTPMDVLRYLHGIANAFVLIEEIELSLRLLIRASVGDSVTLAECASQALKEKYKSGHIPDHLEAMTFDDYVALLRDGRNWPRFEKAFGGTRERWRGRLERVRDLRNDVFHFKRELSVEDHQALGACRNSLLRCCRKVQARRGA